jgi:hypothetical protein
VLGSSYDKIEVVVEKDGSNISCTTVAMRDIDSASVKYLLSCDGDSDWGKRGVRWGGIGQDVERGVVERR